MMLIHISKDRLLKLSLKLAALTFIIAAIFILTDLGYSLKHKTSSYRNTSMYMIETITKKINGMNHVDEKTSSKLNKMLDKFNKQNNNGLFEVDISRFRRASSSEYHYLTVEPKDFNWRAYTAKDGRSIRYGVSDAQNKYDYAEYLKKTEFENSVQRRLGRIAPFIFGASVALMSIYLFGRNRYNI